MKLSGSEKERRKNKEKKVDGEQESKTVVSGAGNDN